MSLSCYAYLLVRRGRKKLNILNAIQAKEDGSLFFVLFYLKTYPLQEVLVHWFVMSQGKAHFLIYQLSRISRETLKRMDHLPAPISKEHRQIINPLFIIKIMSLLELKSEIVPPSSPRSGGTASLVLP